MSDGRREMSASEVSPRAYRRKRGAQAGAGLSAVSAPEEHPDPTHQLRRNPVDDQSRKLKEATQQQRDEPRIVHLTRQIRERTDELRGRPPDPPRSRAPLRRPRAARQRAQRSRRRSSRAVSAAAPAPPPQPPSPARHGHEPAVSATAPHSRTIRRSGGNPATALSARAPADPSGTSGHTAAHPSRRPALGTQCAPSRGALPRRRGRTGPPRGR